MRTPQSVWDFIRDNYPKYGYQYCVRHTGLTNIPYYVKKLGIPFRGIKHIKYIADENRNINPQQFYKVTSPEVAYFLGLFWADGYLLYKTPKTGSRHRYELRLKIIEEDMKHILKSMQKLGKWIVNREQYKHWKPTLQITTSNYPLVVFLKKLGYANKSHRDMNKVLKIIPIELHRYFWRGFLDGDGSIFATQSSLQLSFTGHYKQSWTSLKRLFKMLKIKYRIYRYSKVNKNGRINSFSRINPASTIGILTLLNWIYKNHEHDKIGFPRKLQSYKKGLVYFKHLVSI